MPFCSIMLVVVTFDFTGVKNRMSKGREVEKTGDCF